MALVALFINILMIIQYYEILFWVILLLLSQVGYSFLQHFAPFDIPSYLNTRIKFSIITIIIIFIPIFAISILLTTNKNKFIMGGKIILIPLSLSFLFSATNLTTINVFNVIFNSNIKYNHNINEENYKLVEKYEDAIYAGEFFSVVPNTF